MDSSVHLPAATEVFRRLLANVRKIGDWYILFVTRKVN